MNVLCLAIPFQVNSNMLQVTHSFFYNCILTITPQRHQTLLQLLTENKNATLLRKEILLKLWGDDSFFNSRNLDVYITKLRDYLKNDKTIEIITIKGIGYQFTVNQ